MLPPDKNDPFRPGNWRWLRARWLREANKYARGHMDDADTHLIKKYQSAKAKAQNETELFALRCKYPGLYWAEQINERHADNNTRWIIEARLLANEKLESIAEKTGISHDTVHWYESAFFNVLPYLKHKDYIITTIIGKQVHYGLRDQDYNVLWKLFGYLLGEHMLDGTIHCLANMVPIASQDMVLSTRSDIIKNNLSHKAVMASATIPVAYNQSIILELWNRMVEIERSSGTLEAQNTFGANVSAAVLALKFTTEAPRPNSEAGNALSYYETQDAELRAHELIQVGAGGDTPDLRKAVALKLPEAKDGRDTSKDH